jgi:hypothetical protein
MTNMQFQIGDRVLYVPENVNTEIEGYVWSETIGGVPRIVAYRLSCGISVKYDSLKLCHGRYWR